MGGINTENNIGAASPAQSIKNKEVGMDPITGGKILRGEACLKKTARQCDDQEIQFNINNAESEVNGTITYIANGHPSPTELWLKQAIDAMLVMVDQLGTRNCLGDRSEAYSVLYKYLGLVKRDVMDKLNVWRAYGVEPDSVHMDEIKAVFTELSEYSDRALLARVFEAKIKLAICKLVMKQLSDKENPDEKLGRGKELYRNMISFCQEGREALSAYIGGKIEDDRYHLEERSVHFLLANSYVLEARFRALRNDQTDTDISIKGLLNNAEKYLKNAKDIYNTYIRHTAMDPEIK